MIRDRIMAPVLEREMNDDAMMHVKYPTNFPANHATRIQLQKSSASFATLLHIFSQLSGKWIWLPFPLEKVWVVYIIKLVKSGAIQFVPFCLKGSWKASQLGKGTFTCPLPCRRRRCGRRRWRSHRRAAAAAVPVIMHPSSTTNIRFVPRDKLLFVGS